LLIAEDDPLVQRTIVAAARARGFTVAGLVSNGIDAVSQALEIRPDAILMDIEMPGISGLEATQQIQARHPTPVVIVTAHESDSVLRGVAASGAGAYILKPTNPAALAGGIAIAMAKHADLVRLRREVGKSELLVSEVHHRVANQMSAASALLHLQALHVGNADARMILMDSETRLCAMARIHSRLQPVTTQSHIQLGPFLSTLARDLITGLRPDLKYRDVLMDTVDVPSGIAMNCALITHELVMNSIRHAHSSGTRGMIEFSLTPGDGGRLRLSVADDGCGFPPAFTLTDSSSIGLMIVSTLTRDLGGVFSITPRNPGTECSIVFNPGKLSHHDTH
jgi:two-component sensor histidine kinase